MSQKNKIPKSLRQYVFSDALGSGSFSTVCKVLNIKNQQTYACKVFPRSNLTDPGDQNRFQREINAMAFIRHENIIALHDFFWDENNFYLIMDLCAGGELYEYMVEHGKFDEPTAALIFRQFASAVAYCHSFGVCHRDLKPENILFDTFPRVKVSDFGLCGYLTNEIMMQTFCGSPCYCSPECLCRVKYDGRLADVWSLGVILFSMVTGENPWNINNTSIMLHQILKGAYKMPPNVSQSFQNLIENMLKVNPRERYTMEQVLRHPWIKLGDQSEYAGQEHPPTNNNDDNILQPIPLSIISQLSEKQSQLSDQGIFSPFEDETNGRNEIPSLSLPKLCLQNGVLGQVVTEKVEQPMLKYNSSVTSSKGNLFASRQRSNAVLNAKHNAARLLMPSSMSMQKKAMRPNRGIIQTFL
ncbi:AGC family protein kinase [Tritrichomonas foetus]|uniref:AGC family protein kinase n=1 Tax=Tritrichomonas foetus TaxID=1144522 RepID=A0A1J4KSC5_9EUKA|nr:AGC family protein kinase [Tritrichomonas foetus]|eukprot:OHT12566.1 AGC family protein kinase [Tritrichomonas foetus]